MAPQLAKLAKNHGDKVVILKVDVSRQRDLARRAGVRSIPDTRLLHGGREITRKVGGLRYPSLERMVLNNEKRLPEPKVSEEPQSRERTASSSSSQEGEKAPGTIEPMKDDWLPPGVTRQ